MKRLDEVHDVTTAWDNARRLTIVSLIGERGDLIAAIEIAPGAENGKIVFADTTIGPQMIKLAELKSAISDALAAKPLEPVQMRAVH